MKNINFYLNSIQAFHGVRNIVRWREKKVFELSLKKIVDPRERDMLLKCIDFFVLSFRSSETAIEARTEASTNSSGLEGRAPDGSSDRLWPSSPLIHNYEITIYDKSDERYPLSYLRNRRYRRSKDDPTFSLTHTFAKSDNHFITPSLSFWYFACLFVSLTVTLLNYDL